MQLILATLVRVSKLRSAPGSKPRYGERILVMPGSTNCQRSSGPISSHTCPLRRSQGSLTSTVCPTNLSERTCN